MVTFWGVLVVLGFLAVAHIERGDAALLGELARRAAAHGRLWVAFERSLRPWEADGTRAVTRSS